MESTKPLPCCDSEQQVATLHTLLRLPAMMVTWVVCISAHFHIKVSLPLPLSCSLKGVGRGLGKSKGRAGLLTPQVNSGRPLSKMQWAELEAGRCVAPRAGHVATFASANCWLPGFGSDWPARDSQAQKPDRWLASIHLFFLFLFILIPSLALKMARTRSFSFMHWWVGTLLPSLSFLKVNVKDLSWPGQRMLHQRRCCYI